MTPIYSIFRQSAKLPRRRFSCTQFACFFIWVHMYLFWNGLEDRPNLRQQILSSHDLLTQVQILNVYLTENIQTKIPQSHPHFGLVKWIYIYYLDYALVLKELVPHTSRIIYLFAFWLGMYICNTISRESNRTESLRIVSTDRPADRKTNQTERCGLSKRFLEFTSLSENDILKIITKFDLVLRQPLHSFPGAKVIRK